MTWGDSMVYRIQVVPGKDGGRVYNVVCFGVVFIDRWAEWEGKYNSFDALPSWMQERLAVLNMLSYIPPTETIPGVGRRISEYVFWVVPPTDISPSTSG